MVGSEVVLAVASDAAAVVVEQGEVGEMASLTCLNHSLDRSLAFKHLR